MAYSILVAIVAFSSLGFAQVIHQISGFNYYGCVEFTLSSFQSAFTAPGGMTPEQCQAICVGATFAAIASDVCYCGNSSASWVNVDNALCITPCQGDSQKGFCGFKCPYGTYNLANVYARSQVSTTTALPTPGVTPSVVQPGLPLLPPSIGLPPYISGFPSGSPNTLSISPPGGSVTGLVPTNIVSIINPDLSIITISTGSLPLTPPVPVTTGLVPSSIIPSLVVNPNDQTVLPSASQTPLSIPIPSWDSVTLTTVVVNPTVIVSLSSILGGVSLNPNVPGNTAAPPTVPGSVVLPTGVLNPGDRPTNTIIPVTIAEAPVRRRGISSVGTLLVILITGLHFV